MQCNLTPKFNFQYLLNNSKKLIESIFCIQIINVETGIQKMFGLLNNQSYRKKNKGSQYYNQRLLDRKTIQLHM